MEETLIKKILPHSVEAEQSVIGSMIMDKDAITTATEILDSEDFYRTQYGVLFQAMSDLYQEDKPVDVVTLSDKLKEKELPEELAGIEVITELLKIVPTSANVKYYADIVKEKAVLRRLIKIT